VRHDRVVGAREAGDRVEQHDHVVLVLDQAAGLLDHHLGDLHVALGRFVEGRADDLASTVRSMSVTSSAARRSAARSEPLGVVLEDRVAIFCRMMSCPLGRRDDQPALALADRAEQIHDAAVMSRDLVSRVNLLSG